jgi:serine-type D-Ala-D-Ala carboxypeptidase (penicillin-binding protein 5/6)
VRVDLTSEHRDRRGPIAAFGIAAAVALIGGQAHGQKAAAPPEVTAKSVYVLNADTGQTLYRKGDGKPVRLHSLTKLITADVLMQRMGGRLSEALTIGPPHLTTGSSAGLRNGDVWTLEDLLYGMLLVSGNDAALALADHTGRAMLGAEGKKGDARQRFVSEMGPAAAALGAGSAKFADPHGLSPANVGTAQDVAMIGAGVFRNERLLPFWRCAQRTLEIGGAKPRTVTLDTTVEMLGEDRILGAKTGSHLGKNIYNLVAGWRAPNGQTIVVVVLGSADHPARYRDMRAILAALPRDFPELAAPAGGSWTPGPCPEPPAPPLPSRP